MSESLVLVYEDERAHAAQSPAQVAELIARRARFAKELSGLRDSGRFRPSREGKRVRASGVEDGPFREPRALAAYYWVDTPVDADAVPKLPADVVEVRPVMKGTVVPGKDGRPGKIFGFVVIGREAVMELIDAETQSAFPRAAALGGNRLRATFDGPFLEAKEVIGGVFFLRMLAIEDAVRWAAASRFVVHGALEIRELWRS